ASVHGNPEGIPPGQPPGLPPRRHPARERAGSRRRQGAHPGVRRRLHRPQARRRQRDLQGPQGVRRRGRGAYLPAALPDAAEHRGRSPGPRAPRQAVLPAQPARQGRPHPRAPHGASDQV
ncbi:MAG: LSU ribosomal protein L19p, partial [uncultured Gemmatimonadetes bacterium]